MHANARLTVHARRLLIERIQQGRPIAHVADETGVSRQTAYKWARWRHYGDVGLHDRSSCPRRSPMRRHADGVELTPTLFVLLDEPGQPAQVAAVSRAGVAAVIVDVFAPPERILQIRVRGEARVETHDPSRVRAIYRRYLGEDERVWPISFPERLTDPGWLLWSVAPDSGLAADYHDFAGTEWRWHTRSERPLRRVHG